jgi:hypothetical protein
MGFFYAHLHVNESRRPQCHCICDIIVADGDGAVVIPSLIHVSTPPSRSALEQRLREPPQPADAAFDAMVPGMPGA